MIDAHQLQIKDFSYQLPEGQIALHPLDKRDHSRLLVYQNGTLTDSTFYHLPRFLPAGSALYLNNTRVIAARMHFVKPTGGQIELFCLEPSRRSLQEGLEAQGEILWNCLIGGASKWKAGQVLVKEIEVDGQAVRLEARYRAKEEDYFVILFSWTPAGLPFSAVVEEAGQVPLPPYLHRAPEQEDRTRYQTVFAREEGSVAAPTASLHFTAGVFAALGEKNIRLHELTLHVGAGTFRPVKTETIGEHHMHAEHFRVDAPTLRALIAGDTIIASGTTTLRTLESLYWMGLQVAGGQQDPFMLHQWTPYEGMEERLSYNQSLQILLEDLEKKGVEYLDGQTSLLIAPGYRFRSARALITNFHQPQSTLLLLVAAFIGPDWKKVYEHALRQGYRFLSYGDSSLLWRP